MSLSKSLAPLRRYVADPEKLVEQIRQLSRDVGRLAASLRKEAGHSAGEVAGDVSHYAGELVEHLTPVARGIGRRARSAGRRLRDDPAPAIVAIGTFALICSLFLSRPDSKS